MVLISLITAWAVPRVGSFFYADQLKMTGRKLVVLMHRASQLAQQFQVPYLLTYREQEREFVLRPEREPDVSAGSQNQTRPGPQGDGTQTDEPGTDKLTDQQRQERRLALGDGVTVRDLWTWYGGLYFAEAMTIRFSPNGYAEPTVLHLRKGEEQEMSIIVSPFLGNVQVRDGYVLPEKANVFQ